MPDKPVQPNPYEEILDDEHQAELIRKAEEEWIKNQETWAKENK